MGEIVGTLYLLLPLLGGALVHGLCMKYDWLAALARPIDAGAKLRGEPLFGHSKTWRGPILVAVGSGAVYALQQHALHAVPLFADFELVDYERLPGWWFGALTGAAAELAELPNSFVKRRLRIPPSGTTGGAPGVLFFFWDQVDLLLGFWLVVGFAVPPSPGRILTSLVALATLHPLATLVGYLVGMRPTPR